VALRIALFGQAAFGKDVLDRLVDAGHTLVAAYAPPEGARPDPMAARAAELGIPSFRHRYFRKRTDGGFAPIPRILDEYRGLGAELNVLAYVTAILPPEIVDHPRHRSLCFHPSLLPKYRGGSALAWQIILGESESGVTVFQPDAGVDTGPIVVQKGGVAIGPATTAGSLYFDHLYALGVDAMAEAVEGVARGTARYRPQDESQASFQGLVDDAVARIDWQRDASELDRLMRGCDPQPGAYALRGDEKLRLFDARRLEGLPEAEPGTVLGVEDGRLVLAARGGRLAAGRVRLGAGKKTAAADAGVAPGERLR
jgi:methionyl-tRNA formyltransferase